MSQELATVHTVADIEIMAQKAAKSKMFGLDADQAFVLMALCEADGLHPMQAMRKYHVINGRPSMRADAMQAEFQRIGGSVEWLTESDDVEKQEASFSHPKLIPTPKSIKFTMKDAERAKLLGNPTWAKYPSQMMRARVISIGLRMFAPGIVAGIYTPEEVEEFGPQRPIDVASKVVGARRPAKQALEVTGSSGDSWTPQRAGHQPVAEVAQELGQALESQMETQKTNGSATVERGNYSAALWNLCSVLNEGWRKECERQKPPIEYKPLVTTAQLEGHLISKDIDVLVVAREYFLDAKGNKSRTKVVEYLNDYFAKDEPRFMRISSERLADIAADAQIAYNVSPDED